jgi:hypothetical protein
MIANTLIETDYSPAIGQHEGNALSVSQRLSKSARHAIGGPVTKVCNTGIENSGENPKTFTFSYTVST